MSSQFFVYVLCDYFSLEIRYVGKCTNLQQRYALHSNPETAARAVARWIADSGRAPLLSVLFVAGSEEDARRVELEVIALLYRGGARLVNERDLPERPPMAPVAFTEVPGFPFLSGFVGGALVGQLQRELKISNELEQLS